MSHHDNMVIANVECLSKVMMEALTELSRSGACPSTSSLCQALSKRQDIHRLLDHQRKSVQTVRAVADSDPSEIKNLKARLRIEQAQHQKTLKQLEELKIKNSEAEVVYKRSLLTLLTLVATPENKPFLTGIERFRQSILNEDVDWPRAEEELNILRNSIVKQELRGKGSHPEAPTSFLGKWLKRKDSDRQAGPETVNLKMIKDLYLSILGELQTELGQEHLEGMASLHNRIRESSDLDQLLSVNPELISILQNYTRMVNEERSLVADFFADVGNGLIEMERFLMTALSHSSQVYQSNTTFNTLLDVQMEDIKISTQIGKTLSEVRELVSSKLNTIKTALEHKRSEDERRRREAEQQMVNLQHNLRNMKNEIQQAQEKSKHLEREALVDPLTNIHNVRAYHQRIQEELQRYKRYTHIFSVLLLDVDHFKQVNDTYGHWIGDKCLIEIINRIRPALRDSDFLARYGGEEFIVILPGIDRLRAFALAERLCRLVEKIRFTYQGERITLTISIGVTQVIESDLSPEALFTRVDKAMYEAKRGGRNRAAQL